MKKRPIVRVIAFLAVAAAVIGTLYIVEKRTADAADRALRYQGEQAFEELCESVDGMDAALQKSLYAAGPGMSAALFAEVYARALSADHALSSLAFPIQELEQTASFLATTGDYAAWLLRSAAGGQAVSDADRENLRALAEGTSLLAENLRQLRSDAASSSDSAGDAAPAAGPAALSESFLRMEQVFPDLPTLVYDGPFSSDMAERAPRMTAEAGQIDREAALLIAAGFVGERTNLASEIGTGEGRLPTWRVSVGGYTVSVSRQGGYVVQALADRVPTRSVLSLDDALRAAEKILAARRYGKMVESYHLVEDNVLTVTYCAAQDGVICYPDMIKISVAMDDGSLLRFDAREYLTCHTRRDLPAPALTEQEAAARLPEDLTLEAQRLAVIPSDGTREIFCRELICRTPAGQHCLVYLNALTGEQERILLLLEDETGTLAL